MCSKQVRLSSQWKLWVYFEYSSTSNGLLAVAIPEVNTPKEKNVSSLCVSKSITVDVLSVGVFISAATAVLVGITTNGILM